MQRPYLVFLLFSVSDELTLPKNAKDVDWEVMLQWAFELLASFRSSEFLYADFVDAMKNKGMASDIQASDVLSVLYECSAIGHRYPSHAGQETRFTFKYRNRNSTFNKGDLIILHRGLRKALNVSS